MNIQDCTYTRARISRMVAAALRHEAAIFVTRPVSRLPPSRVFFTHLLICQEAIAAPL